MATAVGIELVRYCASIVTFCHRAIWRPLGGACLRVPACRDYSNHPKVDCPSIWSCRQSPLFPPSSLIEPRGAGHLLINVSYLDTTSMSVWTTIASLHGTAAGTDAMWPNNCINQASGIAATSEVVWNTWGQEV